MAAVAECDMDRNHGNTEKNCVYDLSPIQYFSGTPDVAVRENETQFMQQCILHSVYPVFIFDGLFLHISLWLYLVLETQGLLPWSPLRWLRGLWSETSVTGAYKSCRHINCD